VIWWRILRFDALRLKVGEKTFELAPEHAGPSRIERVLRFMSAARYQREPVPLSQHVVHYPWYNYVYGVEEPVEAELVEEVWAYPSGFYERPSALAFKYRVLIVDAQHRVKTVEKAGARIEILCVRGPEPVARDGRVEAELVVRGERLRFVRPLLATALDYFWLER
jgi:hypothetical protein